MADQRFFANTGPYSLEAILKHGQCRFADSAAALNAQDLSFASVASLDEATKNDVSFLDNPKYKDAMTQTKAGACVISEAMAEYVPQGCVALVSDAPYKSYALIAGLFYPDALSPNSPYFTGPENVEHHIHETAIVEEYVKIGEKCLIGPYVHIQNGAEIGDGCIVETGSVIGQNVVIGDKAHIGAHCSISHAVLGRQVRIHNGVRIGQDGFGFAVDSTGITPVPQLGRVMIGDLVNIGANTTVDRGAGPDTEIGAMSQIDNLVQIAHNVKLGMGCVIAAQTGISGSSKVGDFTMLGGQVGVSGHVEIGKHVRVGAQSGISKNVPDKCDVMGTPAQEKRTHWKELATIRRLSKSSRSG